MFSRLMMTLAIIAPGRARERDNFNVLTKLPRGGFLATGARNAQCRTALSVSVLRALDTSDCARMSNPPKRATLCHRHEGRVALSAVNWPVMNDVTRILSAIEQGDPQAAAQLLPVVYDELRKLAAQKLAQEKPGQTLEATALVHEAYLRLVGEQQFENRGHFFAAAAEAMRRILIDRARARSSRKRGGDGRRVALNGVAAPGPDERLLALDEALTELAGADPLAARVVEMHHFAGLAHEQVAAALNISVYLARQEWAFARAWLKTLLGEL